MTATPLENIDDANPYNQRKDYLQPDESRPVTADSLFHPTTVKEPVKTENKTEDKQEDNHDYKKRWSDLKKRYDTEITKYKQALEQAGETSSETKTTVKVPETPAELEKFKAEQPDLYNLFTGIAKIQVQEETEVVKKQLTEIESRELKLAKEQALEEIRTAHTDFDEITNSDDFHNWAEQQSKEIQESIYNNPTDSKRAINAIKLYKYDVAQLEKGKSAVKNKSKVVEDASSMVSTRPSQEPNTTTKKIWSREEIRKMPMHLYDKYQEEIDLAIMEGRISN